MSKKIPEHWSKNSWEEKAKENPLYAVMTIPQLEDAESSEFSEEHLELFFEKGRKLAGRWVYPTLELAPKTGVVVEYGCGAGRILNALVEDAIPCQGVDISLTMLEHCRNYVPGVGALVCLDESGGVDLPDGSARLVYSYAVVQHIAKLSDYVKAITEMCRLLMPAGRLVLQVNCEDYTFQSAGLLGKTENYEDYSLHYNLSENKCYLHMNTTWSGVYVGWDYLLNLLERCGMQFDGVEPFNDIKPRAQFVFAVKK
jgi:SAM-dependent methyltransferase